MAALVRPLAQLKDSWVSLSAQWRSVCELWADRVMLEFEREHWQKIETAALQEIEILAELEAILREVEPYLE